MALEFSDLSGRGRFCLWLDVSDEVYGMSLDQATLFKRKAVAQAVAEAYASGRKSRLHEELKHEGRREQSSGLFTLLILTSAKSSLDTSQAIKYTRSQELGHHSC